MIARRLRLWPFGGLALKGAVAHVMLGETA